MKIIVVATLLGLCAADVSHLQNLPIVQYTSPLQESYQTTFAPPVNTYSNPALFQNRYIQPSDGLTGSTSYNAPQAPANQYLPPTITGSSQYYQPTLTDQYVAAPEPAPAQPLDQFLAPAKPQQPTNHYAVSIQPSIEYQQVPIQNQQAQVEASSFGTGGYFYRNPTSF